MRQSPFLEEGLFQSTTLEVTIYAQHKNKLFFYDSAGIWPDEAKGILDRLAPGPFRTFLPQANSTVTSISVKNTDLGPLSLRSRSMASQSLSRSGLFMGDHMNVVTRAGGHIGKARRYLGFTRSRLREGEGPSCDAEEFREWTEALEAEISGRVAGADLFRRFALPVDVPAETTPANILIDLDEFIEAFVGENNKKLKIDYENACVEVEELPTPNGQFRHAFTLVINGVQETVLIRWDADKRKYWMQWPAPGLEDTPLS
jgi:hypothetical protein